MSMDTWICYAYDMVKRRGIECEIRINSRTVIQDGYDIVLVLKKGIHNIKYVFTRDELQVFNTDIFRDIFESQILKLEQQLVC